MQQHDPNRQQERPEPASYEPPRIEGSAEFETLALQCSRTNDPYYPCDDVRS